MATNCQSYIFAALALLPYLVRVPRQSGRGGLARLNNGPLELVDAILHFAVSQKTTRQNECIDNKYIKWSNK